MTDAELKSKLTSSLDFLKGELAQIRTGRATTSLVEEITVDAYGSKMKIKELGTLSTPDAQLITIAPWDKTLIKDICAAIVAANISLNPVPDSSVVKVPVPPLTEERRKEFTKLVSERAETCKNSMRGIRQDAMKDIDTSFANKEITEDDKFGAKESVEALVKDFSAKIDEVSEAKKKELMSI